MVLVAFLFASDQKVLFDFRSPVEKPDPARTLSAEARRNLLSAVFPRYLEDERKCKVEDPPLAAAREAARNNGQIAPRVVSQAAGSFTRSGARQVAYLIEVGECGAQGRTYFGTYRLVVFENGRLINRAESPFGDYIETTADVFGDGIEEILISGCSFGQGIVACGAGLVSIAGGSLRTIQDFGGVYGHDCDSDGRYGISADVIRYAPGHPPQFFQKEYKAACAGPGQKPEFRPAVAPKP
jgi:hypothetical protein